MKKLAILFFGAFALATSANAATIFNFDLEADIASGGSGEGGYQPLKTEAGDIFNLLPEGLIANGWNDVGGQTNLVHAYLDGPSGPDDKLAGLGVCSTGLNADLSCAINKDDNIGHGPGVNPGSIDLNTHEWLSLDITGVVGGDNIQGMRFVGIGHDPAPEDGAVDYRVNGGTWMSTTFSALSMMLLENVQTLDLAMGGAFSGGDHDGHLEDQFYLAGLTVVPVPAAVWLFGTAMLGLFGLRRKSKMEALAA